MQLRQVKGQVFLTEAARRRLESVEYPSVETAKKSLQQFFPNHLVYVREDRLDVTNRDKSLLIAEFKSL
jgi:hypothetical protein